MWIKLDHNPHMDTHAETDKHTHTQTPLHPYVGTASTERGTQSSHQRIHTHVLTHHTQPVLTQYIHKY